MKYLAKKIKCSSLLMESVILIAIVVSIGLLYATWMKGYIKDLSHRAGKDTFIENCEHTFLDIKEIKDSIVNKTSTLYNTTLTFQKAENKEDVILATIESSSTEIEIYVSAFPY